MRKILLWALLALFAQSAMGATEAHRSASLHFFQVGFGDLPEEMQLAAEEGKHGLFLMFSAEDCPPCIRMKENIMSLPHVQAYYREHFRVLDIDFNGDVEVTALDGRTMRSKDFSSQVAGIIGTPTVVFLDLDGQELLRRAGGITDVDEFMALARFVVSGEYRNQTFAEFRKEGAATPR
jgi:thioredoxin-related protein